MKKNVLIVTLFDENNIGNRLQNYALQQVLLTRDVDVTVLDNGYTARPKLKTVIKENIKGFLGFLGFKKFKTKYQYYIASVRKRKANKDFDRKNINRIIKISNKEVFNREWSEYFIAIAGSDQVWHRWRDDKFELPFYYLQFMPYEKRTAYAASFGFDKFPLNDILQHEQGLKGMKNISCREKSGCELASSITGEAIQHVLDPTLLLSASEWRKVEEDASNFAKSQKNYAFIYFLGEKTEEYRAYIEQTMRDKGIVNVVDFSDITNQKITECGPCGFLSLIDYADYVFTDSFHCTVFSILFEKHFTVFKRKENGFENMFGRIEDLLASKGKLGNIYGGSLKTETNDFEELYSDSFRYIDKILGIKL